jgi:hypothetical protein
MANEQGQPVLVTTEHRGVFFGYAEPGAVEAWEANTTAAVKLSRVRNCLYWPVSNRGFIGLATDGPKDGARVGPAASQLSLAKVTAIVGVTAAAADAWENAPWSR